MIKKCFIILGTAIVGLVVVIWSGSYFNYALDKTWMQHPSDTTHAMIALVLVLVIAGCTGSIIAESVTGGKNKESK